MENEGFRLPAEWEHQRGIQLTWPHKDTDWAPILDEITAVYVRMAKEIAKRELVLVVAPDIALVRQQLRASLSNEELARVFFFECFTNDTWARDHGFLTLVRGESQIRHCQMKLKNSPIFNFHLSPFKTCFLTSVSMVGARSSLLIWIMTSTGSYGRKVF